MLIKFPFVKSQRCEKKNSKLVCVDDVSCRQLQVVN